MLPRCWRALYRRPQSRCCSINYVAAARFGAVSSNGASPRQSTRRRRVHSSASDDGDDLLRDQPIVSWPTSCTCTGARKLCPAP
jgi:hypothetical protein